MPTEQFENPELRYVGNDQAVLAHSGLVVARSQVPRPANSIRVDPDACGVMVKDGSALARATSIGPSAATGLEVSADTAGGNPRYGITRRGGNNDLLSTLWREVISLAGVARSFSSGGLK